ncbi:hypothetical protein V8G54_002432 [Vigna mungo]|uniref:Uncharacterized protein n=1 Tax=Vigna mungo TaxID=3915 RepID=A0AAQ3PC77_VIGMU
MFDDGGFSPFGNSPIMAILWVLFLRKNTTMVDRMTDVNGAAAETQNNFGFLKLMCLVVNRNSKKLNPSRRFCHDHSSLCLKTEISTGVICILLVKWTIPSNPFSCCSDTIIAAPAMKPTKVAFERKSITKPNLNIPREDWNKPAKKVAVKAILR